jgi:hypothetical protein
MKTAKSGPPPANPGPGLQQLQVEFGGKTASPFRMRFNKGLRKTFRRQLKFGGRPLAWHGAVT